MADTPTPFAAMLQQYMWKRREPPITPARFASEIGINRQTVLNWLKGTKPAADMLPLVARKLDVSLAEVYRAAGYPVPTELQMREDVFEYLRQRIEADAALTPKERQRILEHIHELQEGYRSGDRDRPKANEAAAVR